MEFPYGGKVVIVDDVREEVDPLITALSKRNIPNLYYSGAVHQLPDKPLSGVRIVFLDLRFAPGAEEKTNVGNACSVLQKIISVENGPFMLIIWSSTGDEYITSLKEVLSTRCITPEAIVPLSKADYFTTEIENIESRISPIRNIISENAEMDSMTEKELIDKIEASLYSELDINKKVFIEDQFSTLEQTIDEIIKQAGILSLFVVWENAVQDAASNLVAKLYQEVAQNVIPEKRLTALANSLSYNVLEQRFQEANTEERLQATFFELNDLYTYFFENETGDLTSRISVEMNTCLEQTLKDSASRLNAWKIIRKNGKNETPGRIFKDEEKIFKWKSLAKNEQSVDSIDEKVEEKIDEINKRSIYIYMNINGECETAQKKAKYMKIVPGVVIEKEFFSSLFDINHYKKRDDLYVFDSFCYEGKDRYIIFSLDQCTNVDLSKAEGESLFVLNRKYYLQVRQKIAYNYYKQGIDLY